MKQKSMSTQLPEEGLSVAASEGNRFTRIHLDLGREGVTLAMVGAASASLKESGKRHVLRLNAAKEGVTLAMVGAASAALKD